MGKISARPQKDLNGKDSGLVDIEITYGGNEAPFGGIDTSAPPQYIDPNCFTSAQGFIVSSKRLIAGGWFNQNITLQDWVTNSAIYLGAGTYYANGKYNNWCLGYDVIFIPGSPSAYKVNYYIWVWDAGTTGNIPLTATTSVLQYTQNTLAVAAQAQLGIYGPPSSAVDVGDIIVSINGNAVDLAVNIGDNTVTIATNLAALINSTPATSALVTATASGSKVTLVAVTPGAAGNNITLSVTTQVRPNIPHINIDAVFSGGADATTGQTFGKPIVPLSWVAIGETLYFGGPGTMIMTYSNSTGSNPTLALLTNYLGAVTLNKFGGFLIAGGIVNGPNTVIQAPEMVVAWSANGQFGIWNPLDVNGNVTGAGFNEIADLSDYITGIFIMNSIAIVLHTQGIDYLSLTGSGLQPFDFNHISNSKSGEGCQSSQLMCQYDQIGFFIGNSDVFEYANGLQTVGAKIRQAIIPSVQGLTGPLAALATQIPIDDVTTDVFAMFLIGQDLYFFNRDDRTWMQYNFSNTTLGKPVDLVSFFSIASFVGLPQFVNTRIPTLVSTTNVEAPPVFWAWQPFIQNQDFSYITPTVPQAVSFISEEIDFGKDITIDGLYLSLIGVAGQVVYFTITGQLRGVQVINGGSIVLGTEADGVNPFHYKAYFNGIIGIGGIPTAQAGTFVGKNPQLTVYVSTSITGVKNPFQIVKIKMFGSFDPAQRPV